MLAIFWRIFVFIIIDWEDNQEVDVFNGKDTFFSYEDYGFVVDGEQMKISY